MKRQRPIIPNACLCAGFVLVAILLISARPAHAEPGGNVNGAIAFDTTWNAAGSPYVVTGDVTVNKDVTLTIEPGAAVRFDGNYALVVMGTLRAAGSEAQPIRFTSNASTPAPGDWAVIDFRAESQNNLLEHVIVEYGGNASRPGWMCAPGALCVGTSSFSLQQSTVQKSATRGLVMVQSDSSISNNLFDQNAEEAIRLHGCNTNIGVCRPAIVGNTFTYNAAPIIRASAQDPILAGNEAADNGVNAIVYTTPCVFIDDNTWSADDLVYVVKGEVCNVGGFGPTSLAVEPGTIVKFDTGAGLGIPATTVFSATGTIDQPIIFTSLKDDSAGGDTNADGNASSPAVDDWNQIIVSGAGAIATFAHARFHYGGLSAISTGALLLADYAGTVAIRDSEFSQGETGIAVKRSANIDVVDTVFQNLSYAGVDANSDGAIMISDSRIIGAQEGVLVSDGKPVVHGTYFEGNDTAVTVTCNRLDLPNCQPVISPHNRFVGKNQQGVINRYPKEGCVDAAQNWWADKSGPADASTEMDGCQLLDNPGSGATVSDGVNYSPWDGGVTRPIISWPGCGVTAVNQPRFFGRAQAGAVVTFYDGDTAIGSGTCAQDHSFVIDTTTTLADGEHTISAIAESGGEKSLPSRPLPLTVDSTLDYDPAGIQIVYEYHSLVFTQTLRDENGCAPAFGVTDLDLQVRPGSTMTFIIPIREECCGNRRGL